jgi:hypothetical protein
MHHVLELVPYQFVRPPAVYQGHFRELEMIVNSLWLANCGRERAMARYLACLVCRLFTRGHRWVDRGTQNFEIERRQRELSALERKAKSPGLRLIPAPQQAA